MDSVFYKLLAYTLSFISCVYIEERYHQDESNIVLKWLSKHDNIKNRLIGKKMM